MRFISQNKRTPPGGSARATPRCYGGEPDSEGAYAARWTRNSAVCTALKWILCVFLCFGSFTAQAASEEAVKAAFLYNFAKFVEWPNTGENDPRPFVIGIVGESPIADLLPALTRTERIKGRPIEVRHYRAGDDLSGCRVLFVARGHGMKEIQKNAAGHGVLTVGETDPFLAEGGMIQFVMVNQTVRFDVNLGAAHKEGLKVSSRLLALARKVKDER